MPNLTQAEAQERARLLSVTAQSVDLDVTTGPTTFRSTTEIRFRCSDPGADTFLDLVAPEVHRITLNGTDLDPGKVVTEDRITLSGLAEHNTLTVVADCAYSRTGEGLHRFVDPADEAVYLYSQAALNDAQRIFACFDQPDLKTSFSISVTAPPEWTVLSNTPGKQIPPGRWEFAITPALPTYLAAVVAGPYHSVTAQHGDIPLGVHCRRSLTEHLAGDELFDYTRRAFDHYHQLFGVPYPFGKYDQVWVPEFNLGAMENPGCVIFRDEYVFRSKATDAQHELLAMIIAHEMAHMWFGNLVTMRWWNDLWLNESFAEFMGYLTVAEATRFTSAWTTFCSGRKAWGYRADQLPSTHPVANEAPDTDTALLNFDGISYAKGASVLKQLVAWVGRAAFFSGVHDYFEQHAYGNTTLADLLAALERTSGRDLEAWSREWLETAGVNTLRPEVVAAADGTYASVTVVQTAPSEHPTLRSHRIAIGLYRDNGADAGIARDERVELDVTGERTPVPQLTGRPVADLLLINDEDFTFAKIRFDPRSLETLRAGIGRVRDPLARGLCWAAAWDMLRDGELPAGDYLDLVLRGLASETEIGVLEDLLRQALAAIDGYGDPAHLQQRHGALAARCRELLDASEPGSDRQLALARAYAAAALDGPDVAALQGWLAGEQVPRGLVMDADLRWLVLTRLAVLGAAGEAEIAAENKRDDTATGANSAAAARASRPDEQAKATAWRALLEDRSLSNRVIQKMAGAFWRPEQLEQCRPYATAYLEAMPAVWRDRTPNTAVDLATLLYPRLLVEPETLERTDEVLGRRDLPVGLRRVLLEQRSEVARALHARARDRERD